MSNVPPGPSLRGAVDLSALVRRANAPQPAPGSADGQTGPTGGVVVAATDATFESVVDLSSRVPVVVEFYAPGLQPALGAIIASYGGRLVLATVDGAANPQLAQAFQVREVPAVAAIIAGRPVNLFLDIPPEAQVRQVLDELLALAAENGVTGTIPVDGDAGAGTPGADGEADPAQPAAPIEEPLPPHHQEAFDAIAAGDYAGAVAEYRLAIAQNPRDTLAVAGMAQASLLLRLDKADPAKLRAAAASSPSDPEAALAVADLDVSGGHLDDAFARLLELFPSLDQTAKDAVRARLLEYFEIAGADDPRVLAARRALTNLLY